MCHAWGSQGRAQWKMHSLPSLLPYAVDIAESFRIWSSSERPSSIYGLWIHGLQFSIDIRRCVYLHFCVLFYHFSGNLSLLSPSRYLHGFMIQSLTSESSSLELRQHLLLYITFGYSQHLVDISASFFFVTLAAMPAYAFWAI